MSSDCTSVQFSNIFYFDLLIAAILNYSAVAF